MSNKDIGLEIAPRRPQCRYTLMTTTLSVGITMIEWFRLALRKDIFQRGIKIGVVVGTLLTAINYGDVLLAGVEAARASG